jgi:hypothetical protein
MSTDIFKRWQPHEAVPTRVQIASIRDEDEGLSITIASQGSGETIVKLVFSGVVAYRNINESFRLRTWQSHEMKGSSSLLIIEESSWLKCLRDESCGVLDEFELTHYAIYTEDDCVDVAAKMAPLVVTVLATS